MNIIWIILGSTVLAILILGGIETIQFAIIKRKKCPKCHKKLVPEGTDFFEWNNNYIKHEGIEKDGVVDYYICIVCPHCGKLTPQKKAPVFD